MAYSLDARAHSETGLVRRNNQDSAYVSPTALVVADGMGGAAAGDLASAIAIHEVARADRRLEGDEMLVAFTGAVAQANDLIADLIEEEPALDGMGTTVCGAFFSGEQLGMVHIGDSRAYLFRDGRLTRLSHDHSWVQSLVDEGRLHEDDMATHPHRSLLLRVLNGQASNAPDTELLDVQLDDRLLFCSDGLSGFTTDADLARILAEPDLDIVVPHLIQAAHGGGGADNITFVVADVVPRDDELDAREPCQLGAVVDPELTEILAMATRSPLPAAPRSASDGPADPGQDAIPGDASGDEDAEDTVHDLALPAATTPGSHRAGARDVAASEPDDEQTRYQPTRHRRRWLPTLALAASVVLVIGAAGLGGLLYSRSQYYVGAAPTTNGESVAIFRGLPDSVLGLRLNNVQQVETTLVRDLPSYYRQQVQDTISADNFSAAQQTATQLDSLARACVALRTSATQPKRTIPTTTVTPSASRASASASTRASASASTSARASQRASAPRTTPAAHPTSAHPSSTSAKASATASSAASAGTPTPGASASGASASAVPTSGLTLQDCS